MRSGETTQSVSEKNPSAHNGTYVRPDIVPVMEQAGWSLGRVSVARDRDGVFLVLSNDRNREFSGAEPNRGRSERDSPTAPAARVQYVNILARELWTVRQALDGQGGICEVEDVDGKRRTVSESYISEVETVGEQLECLHNEGYGH